MFVKHLCLLSKKHDQREKSRDDLDRQLSRVKQITLTKTPRKWVIERELRELQRKISLALDNERKLVGMREADSSLVRQLKNEIFKLEYGLKISDEVKKEDVEKNREIISDLGNSIADLREKINSLGAREERIKKLEKKVKRKKTYS